jgi:D-alanine-D-alanine ligase-like ATP-grasp enzyme
MNLDFGAVDIITDENQVIWVLEVNTAPGLIKSTAEAYAEVFARQIVS